MLISPQKKRLQELEQLIKEAQSAKVVDQSTLALLLNERDELMKDINPHTTGRAILKG